MNKFYSRGRNRLISKRQSTVQMRVGLLIDTAIDYTRIVFFIMENFLKISIYYIVNLSTIYYIVNLSLARRNKYVTADAEVSAEGWPATSVECDSAWFSRGRARDDKGPRKNTKKSW